MLRHISHHHRPSFPEQSSLVTIVYFRHPAPANCRKRERDVPIRGSFFLGGVVLGFGVRV